MATKDIILKFFQLGKNPLVVEGIKPIRKLDEIRTGVTILLTQGPYFEEISIKEVYIIWGRALITEGDYALGYYELDGEEPHLHYVIQYHSLSKYPIFEITQTRIKQRQVYIVSEQ